MLGETSSTNHSLSSEKTSQTHVNAHKTLRKTRPTTPRANSHPYQTFVDHKINVHYRDKYIDAAMTRLFMAGLSTRPNLAKILRT